MITNGNKIIAKYLMAVAIAKKVTVNTKFFFFIKKYKASNMNITTNISLCTQAIPSIKINGFSP